MSKIETETETLYEYFVDQRLPYGEHSGMCRLVTGVSYGEDGQPVRILGDDLYSYPEALAHAKNFSQLGIKPFKIQHANSISKKVFEK